MNNCNIYYYDYIFDANIVIVPSTVWMCGDRQNFAKIEIDSVIFISISGMRRIYLFTYKEEDLYRGGKGWPAPATTYPS